MKIFLFIVAVAALAGCTSFSTPPALAHVKVECVSYPHVDLRQTRLYGSADNVVLAGQVERGIGAGDTMRLHLDVSLNNAAGQALRSTVVQFTPRQIPRQGHPPGGRSHFVGTIGPLPPTAATVEVRLHSGEHPSSS